MNKYGLHIHCNENLDNIVYVPNQENYVLTFNKKGKFKLKLKKE